MPSTASSDQPWRSGGQDEHCRDRVADRRQRWSRKPKSGGSSSLRRSARCSSGTTSISTRRWHRSSRRCSSRLATTPRRCCRPSPPMPPASWSGPFGAIVFGRIGDLVGRKYTFLITIMVMGASTFAVGLLPTYAAIGFVAPSSWSPSACCRAWRSAASMAAPRPMSPSMRRATAAAMRRAGSRPRRRSASSCRCW